VIELPQPADLTSLVLRVDFTDDVAWEAVKAAIIDAHEYPTATFVSDPAFAGVSVEALVAADAAASENEKLTYVFVADTVTMVDGEHALLVIDLFDEPGRSFRVPPQWFADVSTNLAIANMDFDEFADATDALSTFRGFQ
jgi:hypothetical protein